MLGYVIADKPELKMREFEVYSGYYCGVCKSIARRYGQLPRMVLSYDAAFLALLLAGLQRPEDQPSREHCLIHPIKKKTIVKNEAIDYAADVMLILAWYKLLDDAHDEGKLYAKAATATLKGIYRKLRQARPALCQKVEENLKALSRLEEEKCASLDQAAEAFAKIMETIFEEGPLPEGFKEQEALRRIGYHLGKWIYLMDAVDDVEENIQSGAYNPLLYRFSYELGEADFQGRIMETCRFNLFHYLGEMAKAADLLTIWKNRGIIENIIYKGLLRKTEDLTQKEE
ncbi:MAG: hypothetical protein HFE75_10565 [Firmicutes bacterium]|jgi:hypothetical protein|nr:hypothetical protein [Bacillota bacterium]NBI64092.1 hypothetical protein [Clostridiales bacterium]